MSAYANIARAWGADVRGWDAQETIFSRTLDGIDVDVGGEPVPPDGYEAIVSTAHRDRIEGTPRATFLAELVAARPSIVVTGAHGKTTTTAMIAFALREVEGMSTEEVCKILEVSANNLGVLLFRARNGLRECLEAKGFEGSRDVEL